MMRAFRTLAVALVLAAGWPVAGQRVAAADAASAWIDMPKSRLRLVASPARTAAGAHLAGLEMVMEPGWHTYWRMPGEAGVPPTFDWSGSTNVAAIEVLYPAPIRMQEAGALIVGYEKAVLFPIEVTPEVAGEPVRLELSFEYGICREICIPASTKLAFALPPAGTAGGHAEAIRAALERVPRPPARRRKTDPELRHAAVGGGATPRLTIEAAFPGGKAADVLIEAPDGLYVPLPRKVAEAEGGIVRFAADLSENDARRLSGKTLTLTLVGEAGASEAQWTAP